MSKTKELAEALAYEPKPRTIDDVTREAFRLVPGVYSTKPAYRGMPMGKQGDTLVIRKPVPYKPR